MPGENMAKFEDCEITYQVELETKNLQEESKKVREELKELNNSGSKVSKGLELMLFCIINLYFSPSQP
ncbi:hypothetical protein [Gilliamella apicola]|nr:hypothetical protein [Gilliamella apicola]OCG13649.1 hypothetical protein A9G14_02415 [Gilliamella apicola]ORF45457.1 hypothetical protein B5800_07665 [Gilliamella apicola]ORF45749.1 hypothetical protein B5803_13190 [Gilliamella apicola]ORF47397.1 hypothetical protein B5799_12705 [Gilliamella apicola]ORF47771.1 hypothetical protein B5802_13730 [Gilliamella apicola]